MSAEGTGNSAKKVELPKIRHNSRMNQADFRISSMVETFLYTQLKS